MRSDVDRVVVAGLFDDENKSVAARTRGEVAIEGSDLRDELRLKLNRDANVGEGGAPRPREEREERDGERSSEPAHHGQSY